MIVEKTNSKISPITTIFLLTFPDFFIIHSPFEK
jgi:hypothetical protein